MNPTVPPSLFLTMTKPRSRGDEPYRFKNNGFNKYSIHAKMPIAGNEKMIGRLEAGDNA